MAKNPPRNFAYLDMLEAQQLELRLPFAKIPDIGLSVLVHGRRTGKLSEKAGNRPLAGIFVEP